MTKKDSTQLDQKYLKEILNYNSESGVFSWKKRLSNRVNVNDRAGVCYDGYLLVGINNNQYPAHRLAWFYVYGEWPENQIDHINHNRADNRIINLRLASYKINSMNRPIQSNNTSGYVGVGFDKRYKKWSASIKINGKRKGLGYYFNVIDAVIARKMAEYKHGFHVNHGSAKSNK